MPHSATGKVCVVLSLSGQATHWFRYYAAEKVWRAACGQPVSDYEDGHRSIRSTRALTLSCPACRGKLASALLDNDERNRMWEVLFNGRQE